MKTGTLLGVALVTALVTGTVLFQKTRAPSGSGLPSKTLASGASDSGLSVTERQRIRAFWDTYQEATRLKQARDWKAAAREYRRALELDPAHWDSLYYLGNALMEIGQFQEAEQAYKRLAASDSQAARAYSALGALYSTPKAASLFDLGKAEQEYRRAAKANGDESGSILRLGEIAVAAGDTGRAQEYLQAAGRTNFKSVSAFFLQGYLAWEAGDSNRAHAMFQKAVKLTKVVKPPAGVLGEGDTRLPGYRAMTLPGQRGLFDAYIAELWVRNDGSQEHMNRAYNAVQSFQRRLPRHTP